MLPKSSETSDKRNVASKSRYNFLPVRLNSSSLFYLTTRNIFQLPNIIPQFDNGFLS